MNNQKIIGAIAGSKVKELASLKNLTPK